MPNDTPRPATTAWQPFDYNNYGQAIGGYEGTTTRLVVLAAVYPGTDGPEFDEVEGHDFGSVDDTDRVLRFMPLQSPEPPHAE
jgi:hypothetical protein